MSDQTTAFASNYRSFITISSTILHNTRATMDQDMTSSSMPNDTLPPPLEDSTLAWYYINGLGGSLLALFGIPGNVTAAIVMLLPAMRNSTSLLLVVMAVFDTLFLLLHALLQTLPLVFITHDVCPSYLLVREFLFKYCYALVHIAHTGTIYMTVLVTLERSLVVLLPLRAKHICTRARAGLASLVVGVWATLYNVPRCLEYVPEKNQSLRLTDYTVSKSDIGRSHFFNVVYLIYLNSVFHFVIPVGLTLVLNVRMVMRVCVRGQRLTRLGRSRGESQTRLTITIVTLTAIFCVCQLLAAMELMLDTGVVAGAKHSHTECKLDCHVISAVAETSTLVNSATNFLVYSILGHKFRQCLRRLCCYCCCFWSATRLRSLAVSTSSASNSTHYLTSSSRLPRLRNSEHLRSTPAKSSLTRLVREDSNNSSGNNVNAQNTNAGVSSKSRRKGQSKQSMTNDMLTDTELTETFNI